MQDRREVAVDAAFSVEEAAQRFFAGWICAEAFRFRHLSWTLADVGVESDDAKNQQTQSFQ